MHIPLRSPIMTATVTTSGRVLVGSGELTRGVPRSVRITVTDSDPYDVALRLNWDPDEQRLVVDEARITRRAGGPAVQASVVAGLKLAQLIEGVLLDEALDDRGFRGIVDDHPDADPAAVDALVYAMAHALGGHRPTQIVAEARGLQPGSGIKRVMQARRLGYLGAATKGRSGGLGTA